MPRLPLVRQTVVQADQSGAQQKRHGGRGGDFRSAGAEDGKEAEGGHGVHRRLFQARDQMGGVEWDGGLPHIAPGIGEGEEEQAQADEDRRARLRRDRRGRVHEGREEAHRRIIPIFPALFALQKEGGDRRQARRVEEPIPEKPRCRLALAR